MRWTEEQLADWQRKNGVPGAANTADVSRPPFKLPANEAGALGRGKVPAEKMNKTEAAYSAHLEVRRLAGDILWHRFQPWRLRLADGALYTPDFGVLNANGFIECHETKGFWREAARVRIKVAASIHPFKFIAIKRKPDGGWSTEEFA